MSTPTKQALPLLRYRTGDIASLHRGTCACGRTLVRMSKVVGRRDDMLVIRGVNLYPSEVEAVLLADPRVSPHYQLVVDRRSHAPTSWSCCEIPADAESVIADLDAALAARLGLHLDVRVLPAGAVPRAGGRQGGPRRDLGRRRAAAAWPVAERSAGSLRS